MMSEIRDDASGTKASADQEGEPAPDSSKIDEAAE